MDDTPERHPSDHHPGSGNRWEPGPGDAAGSPAAPGTPPPPPSLAPEPAGAPARTRRELPTWLTRTRPAIAGGAAAVLLLGGVGGFAVGRTTAPDPASGTTSPVPGAPGGRPDGFDGPDGPGGLDGQPFGDPHGHVGDPDGDLDGDGDSGNSGSNT